MSRRGAIGPIGVHHGYRRVHVVLNREGWDARIKIDCNFYNTLRLHPRSKAPKRQVKAKLRDDRAEAVGPNDV